MIRNNTSSWGSVARWFHWILGAAIIGMLAFGAWMNHIPARPDRFFYRSIHADIGYLVLVLTVARLIWRSINPAPALPDDTPRWQRIGARISHGALYALTILVAMLGWAHSGAHKPDYADWFGLFHVPQITSADKVAAQAHEDRHIFFAYVLLALIVIHMAAAAWHHFVKRDRVTSRMVDGSPGRSSHTDLEFLQCERVFLPPHERAANSVWDRPTSSATIGRTNMSRSRMLSKTTFLAAVCLASAFAVTAAKAQNATEIQLSYKDKKFDPAEISAPANTPIVIKLKNLDAKAMEFESKTLHVEKVVAASSDAVINVRAQKPGRYEFFDEYNEKVARGALVVK